MEQSPSWEATSHPISQEIPRHSHKLNVHYRVHKSLPQVPVITQMYPFHRSDKELNLYTPCRIYSRCPPVQ